MSHTHSLSDKLPVMWYVTTTTHTHACNCQNVSEQLAQSSRDWMNNSHCTDGSKVKWRSPLISVSTCDMISDKEHWVHKWLYICTSNVSNWEVCSPITLLLAGHSAIPVSQLSATANQPALCNSGVHSCLLILSFLAIGAATRAVCDMLVCIELALLPVCWDSLFQVQSYGVCSFMSYMVVRHSKEGLNTWSYYIWTTCVGAALILDMKLIAICSSAVLLTENMHFPMMIRKGWLSLLPQPHEAMQSVASVCPSVKQNCSQTRQKVMFEYPMDITAVLFTVVSYYWH